MNSNNSNISDFIKSLKWQYCKIKVNAISADTINKKPLAYWKQCQNKLVSKERFLEWIELGLFDKDLAIVSGLAYREKKGIIFPTTIELLMTMTGNSSSTIFLSMSIANSIT
jgi:hypothetical protein